MKEGIHGRAVIWTALATTRRRRRRDRGQGWCCSRAARRTAARLLRPLLQRSWRSRRQARCRRGSLLHRSLRDGLLRRRLFGRQLRGSRSRIRCSLVRRSLICRRFVRRSLVRRSLVSGSLFCSSLSAAALSAAAFSAAAFSAAILSRLLTPRCTVEPFATCAPSAGSWDTTCQFFFDNDRLAVHGVLSLDLEPKILQLFRGLIQGQAHHAWNRDSLCNHCNSGC